MADKPILFSAPMVRALLDGRKTMTRRILTPQPYSNGFHFDGRDILCHDDWLPPSALLIDKGKGKNRYTASNYEDGWKAFTGMYVGTRLWVREAWRTFVSLDDVPPRELWPTSNSRGAGVLYEADLGGLALNAKGERWMSERSKDRAAFGRLRASMHMPRWASRITLDVISVKVERLQDISEEDADAEAFGGDFPHRVLPHLFPDADKAGQFTLIECFSRLWNSINGPDAWAANPFVAATTFTVHLGNIDDATAPARG